MTSILHKKIKEWLEQYKRNSVKPTTFDRLEISYRALLNYRIAYMGILDIRAEDLQDYINQMVQDGYALTTIKKQYLLVTSYLKFANAEGILPRPIYNNVKLPAQSAVRKKKREIVSYNKPQQIALRRELQTGKRIGYAAALLMLETGMRVGEALALTWDDVLWEKRAIRIDKTLIRIVSQRRMEVQDGAKSFSSNRTIPLSANAMELLNDLCEKTQNPNGYIFDAGSGIPISYSALRTQIKQACKQANVPYYGHHVFRHTFATNCYNKGCDVKILSKILGHADVTVTYNIYIHLFGDALEEMRAVVG